MFLDDINRLSGAWRSDPPADGGTGAAQSKELVFLTMMMNPRKSWFVVKRLRDSYHSELFTLSPCAFSKVNPVISPLSADSLTATIFCCLCFISCIYGCHVQNELYFQCFVLFFLNKMILAHGRNSVCVWSLYLLKKFELSVGAPRAVSLWNSWLQSFQATKR